MASYNEVGGNLYIGSAPASNQIPEHSATVSDDQVVGHAVVAGPFSIAATVIVEGVLVVI